MLFNNPLAGAVGNVYGALRGGAELGNRDWVRMRRPYLDRSGRACLTLTDLDGGFTVNDSTGGERKPLLRNYLIQDLLNRGMSLPITANATGLTKEAWIELDKTVLKAYRQRLRAAADLEAANSYGGFNAMGKMTLETQRMSDPGEAVVDMDARTDARTDTPLFDLTSLPLPITHSDFGYSNRELEVSRSGLIPLDTAMIEIAGRRVGESVEDQVIGNVTGVTYATQTTGYGTHTGTSTVYGYRTFPQRLTKTNFTVPTGSNASVTLTEVLAAIEQLQAQFHYGPYIIYHSTDWTQFMNNVFSVSGGNHPGETLRSMILKNPDIQDVRRLDRLTTTYTLLFVSMQPEVAQMVNGMDIATVQWEEKGGLEKRYKVMCIKVPRLRSDYNSRTGILHGTTA